MPVSELYTRHRFQKEMALRSGNEFPYITLIKRLQIVAVKHFLHSACNGAAVVEQHQGVIAESACPPDIVEDHNQRFALPCQFLEQHHCAELVAQIEVLQRFIQ